MPGPLIFGSQALLFPPHRVNWELTVTDRGSPRAVAQRHTPVWTSKYPSTRPALEPPRALSGGSHCRVSCLFFQTCWMGNSYGTHAEPVISLQSFFPLNFLLLSLIIVSRPHVTEQRAEDRGGLSHFPRLTWLHQTPALMLSHCAGLAFCIVSPK